MCLKDSRQRRAHLYLDLPENDATNYEWWGVDWNPAGHPSSDVYTVVHFDLHVYTISKADADAIPSASPPMISPTNSDQIDSSPGGTGRTYAPHRSFDGLDSRTGKSTRL